MTENPTDPVADRMREEWDQRAREHARRYINDQEFAGFDFLLSGCRDVFEILVPLNKVLRHDMHMVEIGCGIGRMLPFFSMLFEKVHGIDVAPGMVEQGRELWAHVPNIEIHLGDGRTLSVLPDQSCDLVLSFQVLQHVPDREVVRDYVRDSFRVLRPGGIGKFMVKIAPWPGQPPEPNTWDGVDLSRADLDIWLGDRPWKLLNAYECSDPTRAWVVLEKPA